jgi:hypothetical protein
MGLREEAVGQLAGIITNDQVIKMRLPEMVALFEGETGEGCGGTGLDLFRTNDLEHYLSDLFPSIPCGSRSISLSVSYPSMPET